MFTKTFLKTKPVCKVKFTLTRQQVGDADQVHIAGDFNDWNTSAAPMKKLKNGDFTYVLDLKKGNVYQFRYLLNKTEWINDEMADDYSPSGFPGIENSVISVK